MYVSFSCIIGNNLFVGEAWLRDYIYRRGDPGSILGRDSLYAFGCIPGAP
jgi:hypothetical protein